MRFDPMADLTLRIWEQYPEFRTRNDLHKMPMDAFNEDASYVPTEEDLDTVIRFTIMYCTRAGNPLASETDLSLRRNMAYQMLGIKKGNPVMELIDSYHPWVVQIMAVYMRMIGEQEYSGWLAAKTYYNQCLQLLMADPMRSADPSDLLTLKDKAAKQMAALEDTIRKKETMLFGDTRLLNEISEMEQKILDGPGGFAEYYVAKDWNAHLWSVVD